MPYRIAAIREFAREVDERGAVIGTDASGTVVYWNRQAEELYGWPSQEAMGRNILDLTPTTMSAEEGVEIMNMLLQGRAWKGPFIVRDRAGHPMIVDVEDYPVTAHGNVVGIVGVSFLRSTF